MADIDPGELERLGSALRLAESALEEALEAAENLGNFDRRFDVPRAIGGAAPGAERERGGRGGARRQSLELRAMAHHDPAEKITEKPRVEEHYIYALLALPVFLVTILIVTLIATIGTK